MLKVSEIHDFMFIWALGDDENMDKELLSQNMKSIATDCDVRAYDGRIVIKNMECGINGYNKSWPIDFDECLD